ncbi:MAG: hypothetical protein LQ340_002211 [Diploschistes diacapsis]|nr:MAG: hypothetical protein LQ340_002211 [Diploschistes diacapsis]
MVLKHTEVAYRSRSSYFGGLTKRLTLVAAPDASEPESPPSPQSSIEVKPAFRVQIPKRPVTPVTPSPTSYNQLAFTQNDAIYVDASKIPSSQSQMKPAVVIPSTQLSSHAKQYRIYEHASESNPKKRKRSDDEGCEASDQRALADAALQSLEETLWEIFDAEDHFDTGASGSNDDGILTSVHGLDGDFVTLTASTNIKLESSFHKVISMNRFKNVSIEDITRIQKLGEGGLVAAEAFDGSIKAGWGDDEVSSWLEGVEVIEAAFRSARTILRTMSGGKEEKQLYPEEILQRIISLLTKVTDSCLTRVVESRSSGDSADIFLVASLHSKVLSHLLHSASKVMHLLLDIISKEELAEKPINDVLFFVIRLLFVENSPSEKESVLGIHKFEAFRRTAMNVISKIYSQYEDQREFIIREVLESLQKLPTTKHARQYKLPDGKRLQLTSVLLIRLVSTSGTPGAPGLKSKVCRLLPEINQEPVPDEAEDQSGSSGKDEVSDDDQPLSKTATTSKKFVPDNMRRLARTLYDSASHSAQRIINFLVYRASTCSKTGEQPHRHLLDMFIEDLVEVFSLPEWPASELLLRALVGRMIELAESSQSLAPAKNMALELLGVIGSAILDVTAKAKQTSRSLETDDSRLSGQLSLQLEDMSNGAPQVWDIAGRSGPYRVVLDHLSEADTEVQGYHLTQWIKFIFWGYNPTSGSPQAPDINHVPFATKVCKALADGKWANQE